MTVDGYRTDTLDLPQNVPTRGTDDAFGRMVHDHWRGAYAGGAVMRDPSDRTRDAHPEWYFGAAFDLGCGAGQHALEFQADGTPVVAGDRSGLALRVARDAGVGRAQRVRGPSRVRRGPGDWPTTVPDGVRRAVGRWVSLLLLSREAAIRAVAPMSWRLVDTIDGGGSRYYLQLER